MRMERLMMSQREEVARWLDDIERAMEKHRPDQVTIARNKILSLLGGEHARSGFCEKCWGEAYLRQQTDGRPQVEHYNEILADLAPPERDQEAMEKLARIRAVRAEWGDSAKCYNEVGAILGGGE
jgi:hypothetical protein